MWHVWQRAIKRPLVFSRNDSAIHHIKVLAAMAQTVTTQAEAHAYTADHAYAHRTAS